MTARDINILLKEKGLTLGSAESFTGGLFASEITKVPGASKVFKGAVVTYATEEKINVLGVPIEIVHRYGVVSKNCAESMAECAKKLLNVDVAISFTGNAGPDTMEGKPVGEIHIGVSIKDRNVVTSYLLKGNRQEIQQQGISLGFELIEKIINENF